ncbi:hypothetical protein SMSP2_00079 [Limihaloglobus sulfuriphilus]|uniref:PEP-CTERM protein-sorting domain-containing protein n=1 Tax=Limihaloglobus sulfuriphilus TaxID=1851148 RepID=A0A1Q2MAJ3_9BACT|nr:PEP-CTERM sorting domain-containing protein [Limihaloglobus sulfuriphilus]AQQ69745.1 hypothetical protein SMSP2_00079 [Limihaloglobus sulfuriphilus]
MKAKKNLIVLCAVFAALTSITNAAFILEESFESPVITPDKQDGFLKSYYSSNDPGTYFGSWLIVSGSIEVANDTYSSSTFDAYDGHQRIALNGDEPGRIGIELATTVDQEYEVEFYIYKDFDVTVGFAANSGDNFLASKTSSAGGDSWQKVTWNFTAQGTSTWLFFEGDANTEATGPSLDMVTVEPVPEPATVMIFALGGIGMLSMRRHK